MQNSESREESERGSEFRREPQHRMSGERFIVWGRFGEETVKVKGIIKVCGSRTLQILGCYSVFKHPPFSKG